MKHFLLILTCLLVNCISAQPDSLFLKAKQVKNDGPEWKQENKASFDLSQISFTNWNSGGANSISGLLGYKSSANYKDKYFNWRNDLSIRYGVNKQESRELRKTDDLFEINSDIGYNPSDISDWFYSAKFNFRTQLTNGYRYPNTDNPISRLLAPGYLFLGAGMEYGKKIERFAFYFSPITIKTTFVLDEELANAGSFGVARAVFDTNGNLIKKGERSRREFGILITNGYEMEVAENINVKHRVSLFTDYINKFGNIDVDWRIDFDFKVNNYIRATLGSHIRYDNDVKTQKTTAIEGELTEVGAKVQWQQILGVGFAIDF